MATPVEGLQTATAQPTNPRAQVLALPPAAGTFSASLVSSIVLTASPRQETYGKLSCVADEAFHGLASWPSAQGSATSASPFSGLAGSSAWQEHFPLPALRPPCPAPRANGPFLSSPGRTRHWLLCLHSAGKCPHRGPVTASPDRWLKLIPCRQVPVQSPLCPWTLVRWDRMSAATSGEEPGCRRRFRAKGLTQHPLILGATSAWFCTVQFRDEQTETLGGWIGLSSRSHCVESQALTPNPCAECPVESGVGGRGGEMVALSAQAWVREAWRGRWDSAELLVWQEEDAPAGAGWYG